MATRGRTILWVLAALLAWSAPAAAQAPATYQDRAALMRDDAFLGRVTIAATIGAFAVITEDAGTPDHAIRVKLAGYVLREPEVVARRLMVVLSALAPATVTAGVVSVPLTDAQLQGVIAQRWTVIATSILGGVQ